MTMNNEPSVSVIIPVFNVEQYLMACLDSVLRQTYGSWEAICVNDGSTDGSAQILAEYANRDSRIRVITQRNAGLSAARNAGMRVAHGKYILFLDSDDYLRLDTLQVALDAAENQKLDQVVFGAEICRECDGGICDAEEDYLSVPMDVAGKVMNGTRLFAELHARKAFNVCVPLRLFLRESLPEGLEFPEGVIHEDNYFTPVALFAAQRAMVIGDRLYRRRVRAGSIMTGRGMQQKRANGYAEVRRLLCKTMPVEGVVSEARTPYRDYLWQLRLSSLWLSGHKKRAAFYAWLRTFRDRGCLYAISRLWRFIKEGR